MCQCGEVAMLKLTIFGANREHCWDWWYLFKYHHFQQGVNVENEYTWNEYHQHCPQRFPRETSAKRFFKNVFNRNEYRQSQHWHGAMLTIAIFGTNIVNLNIALSLDKCLAYTCCSIVRTCGWLADSWTVPKGKNKPGKEKMFAQSHSRKIAATEITSSEQLNHSPWFGNCVFVA